MTQVPSRVRECHVSRASVCDPASRGGRWRRSGVHRLLWVGAASWMMAAGCGQVREPAGSPPEVPRQYIETGRASWYGAQFAGRRTASGERYDPRGMTAAHRTLPLGSIVQVTNLENGRSVRVRINDRGPFAPNRVLDCSEAAARVLGFHRKGLAHVGIDWPRAALGSAGDHDIVVAQRSTADVEATR